MGSEGCTDETALVLALRAGDEAAFDALVTRHHGSMVRLARTFAKTDAVAEEVVQVAWLGVLAGIDRFEGRSTLRAWIARIVVNTAKKRAVRESRSVPFSSFDAPDSERAVDASRFYPADHALWPGHWQTPPEDWPEEALLTSETRAIAARAIADLPPAQRQALLLRDAEGLDAETICEELEITDGNLRVLLHRARSSVRRAIEEHLSGTNGGGS